MQQSVFVPQVVVCKPLLDGQGENYNKKHMVPFDSQC